ncbi:FecR family protein [Aestuariivivens marinum]|uniref:FecR family protein n=1 Tax=Aestuariivivens marinum TaxID=2913555 RepID=UPI001F5AE368|nr:FecR domain-containing protein [Aestuariivivens marinum]
MEFKLIIKKINGTLTSEEKQVFKKWYEESQRHRDYFNLVKNNYNKELDFIDVEKGWLEIQTKLKLNKSKKHYWKYAVAASVAILITFGLFFQKEKFFPPNQPQVVIENNPISIGTDKATLTLSDGSVVALEKGKNFQVENLSSNGEKLIYTTDRNIKSEIKYNYLTIPRGGQFQIALADGTQVWLNSESQLKYPEAFVEGETREVELVYGEAYFDVSSSAKHNGSKFIVLNQNQRVEVLGTEFNIKAYKEENNIYTTLVEGKVNVDNGIESQILKPNEQSVISIGNENIAVNVVDVYSETAWRKGLFSFKGKPLKEIMVVLSRWYDVEVKFIKEDLKEVRFNGVLSKKDSIREILDAIKTPKFINAYEIKDKRITIE